MIYYKELDSDDKVLLIGTCESLITGVEISKEEYDKLYNDILNNAVHVIVDLAE